MTAALTLVMTTAGLGRFTAAQVSDDIDLTIAAVGFTESQFVVAPSLTNLPGEFRRIGAVSGEKVGDNVVHMIIRDADPLGYTVRGFGLFLADGTLFAVYGQDAVICEKSPLTTLLMPLDIAFPTSAIDKLVFGDTNFLDPPATTETKGIVELATIAEGEAGDDIRVTTGAVVKAMIATALAMVADAMSGLMARTIYGGGLVTGGGDLTANRTLTVTGATPAQLLAAAAANVALTPASFAGTASLTPEGWERRPSGVIEQWGVWTGAQLDENSFSIPFHFDFPTACAGCTATVINPSASTEGDIVPQEVSLSKAAATFFAQNEAGVASGSNSVRWRAWGY